jgi:hypothetical protein
MGFRMALLEEGHIHTGYTACFDLLFPVEEGGCLVYVAPSRDARDVEFYLDLRRPSGDDGELTPL